LPAACAGAAVARPSSAIRDAIAVAAAVRRVGRPRLAGTCEARCGDMCAARERSAVEDRRNTGFLPFLGI
jgi:hypothetical protein